jgi:hypothetical protein
MRKAKKPTAPKLGKELTAAEVQERRAEAFFQMEEPMRNCSDRAEIVGELLRAGRQDLCEERIYQLEEMLVALMDVHRKAGSTHAQK